MFNKLTRPLGQQCVHSVLLCVCCAGDSDGVGGIVVGSSGNVGGGNEDIDETNPWVDTYICNNKSNVTKTIASASTTTTKTLQDTAGW